jgi:energy-coupling factor transporter transmembrane protein EcfT
VLNTKEYQKRRVKIRKSGNSETDWGCRLLSAICRLPRRLRTTGVARSAKFVILFPYSGRQHRSSPSINILPKMTAETNIRSGWQVPAAEEESYSRLSVPAIFSAVFGLGTFLVFFSPWFFFMGVTALLLSFSALWTISRSGGNVAGRTFAFFGLGSALTAVVAAAVFWACYQYAVRSEADKFFRLWFAAVRQQNLPAAKEFQRFYPYRSKAGDAESWWKEQYADRNAHYAVHQFAENKLLRVLLALGSKAQVTYYKMSGFHSTGDDDTVSVVYAVTFPSAAGGAETFFVKMTGKRLYPPASANFTAAAWRLEGTPEIYVPEEFFPHGGTPQSGKK